jgi:hypothetical protein
MEQMEIAYNNNEAQEFYEEVNNVRKGIKPQRLLIIDKEGNIISNKDKVLQRWSELYYEKHFELKMEQTMRVEKSGQCAHKLQKHMLKQKMKELKKVIYEIISKIWEEEVTPHGWQYGIKCPILKKGDRIMCDSYRAVT